MELFCGGVNQLNTREDATQPWEVRAKEKYCRSETLSIEVSMYESKHCSEIPSVLTKLPQDLSLPPIPYYLLPSIKS